MKYYGFFAILAVALILLCCNNRKLPDHKAKLMVPVTLDIPDHIGRFSILETINGNIYQKGSPTNSDEVIFIDVNPDFKFTKPNLVQIAGMIIPDDELPTKYGYEILIDTSGQNSNSLKNLTNIYSFEKILPVNPLIDDIPFNDTIRIRWQR